MLAPRYSLPAVAAFLGHSSPSTTAAVYAHAVIKNNDNVADVLEAQSDRVSDKRNEVQ